MMAIWWKWPSSSLTPSLMMMIVVSFCNLKMDHYHLVVNGFIIIHHLHDHHHQWSWSNDSVTKNLSLTILFVENIFLRQVVDIINPKPKWKIQKKPKPKQTVKKPLHLNLFSFFLNILKTSFTLNGGDEDVNVDDGSVFIMVGCWKKI